MFKNFIKDYSDFKKISQYCIKAQEKINSDGKLRIFKTHNGNYNFLGNDFTNKKNTLGVIYIVRDPRNIITSISNHYQLNMEQSVSFMLDKKRTIIDLGRNDTSEQNVINLLCSWKDHYNSWKISSNLILIKYEDLLNDIKSQIDRLSLFLKKFGKFESKLIGDKIENSGIFLDAEKISSKVFGSKITSGFKISTYSVVVDLMPILFPAPIPKLAPDKIHFRFLYLDSKYCLNFRLLEFSTIIIGID